MELLNFPSAATPLCFVQLATHGRAVGAAANEVCWAVLELYLHKVVPNS
jgi:hypothetical protein